jgi:hypothetical protein
VLDTVFAILLSPNSGGSWAQTLNLEIMRKVFYHCASATGNFLPFPFSQSWWLLGSNPQPWNNEAIVLPLFHCWAYFCHFLTPGTGGSWDGTLNLGMMKQVLYHCATICGHIFATFLSSNPGGSWAQTLNLEIMWKLFYHCAITTGNIFVFSFLPVLVAARLKPLP